MNDLYLNSKIYQKIKTTAAVLSVLAVIIPQSVLALAITPQNIVDLTNAERLKNGQTILTVDARLAQSAQAKARNMIENNYFDHFGPNGETPWQYILGADYDYRFAGENLAMNFNQAEDVVQAWMNSPTHKDNIIDENFDQIGVVVVDGVIEGDQTTLVVQMFGKEQDSFIEFLTPKVSVVEYVGELLGINQSVQK
jgi:uncharacterized protein YkwD